MQYHLGMQLNLSNLFINFKLNQKIEFLKHAKMPSCIFMLYVKILCQINMSKINKYTHYSNVLRSMIFPTEQIYFGNRTKLHQESVIYNAKLL